VWESNDGAIGEPMGNHPVGRAAAGPGRLSLAYVVVKGDEPIDGDEIVVDLNRNEINCTALRDAATHAKRKAAWERVVADNGGVHPSCGQADTRLLHRARHMAVPATRGGGMHPNREVWVREPRQAERSGFVPRNKHRPA